MELIYFNLILLTNNLVLYQDILICFKKFHQKIEEIFQEYL